MFIQAPATSPNTAVEVAFLVCLHISPHTRLKMYTIISAGVQSFGTFGNICGNVFLGDLSLLHIFQKLRHIC